MNMNSNIIIPAIQNYVSSFVYFCYCNIYIISIYNSFPIVTEK